VRGCYLVVWIGLTGELLVWSWPMQMSCQVAKETKADFQGLSCGCAAVEGWWLGVLTKWLIVCLHRWEEIAAKVS
jgi:hypothetical protein